MNQNFTKWLKSIFDTIFNLKNSLKVEIINFLKRFTTEKYLVKFKKQKCCELKWFKKENIPRFKY